MDNGWGILRVIIDTCMKLSEGKYLILKDPNKVWFVRIVFDGAIVLIVFIDISVHYKRQ